MTDAPIGIFDSGVGGLTVARAVLDQLPHEPILYVGDSARGPYGPLPLADVRRYALDITDHLVHANGVKMLVIACNSASAAVLRDARERYDVPVIEVIAPAVRRAVNITRNGRVGVIGTQATVTSMAYLDSFAAAPHLRVFQQACPRFVEFVEDGVIDGPQVRAAAHEYLDPLVASDIDTLILGCTHYPMLTALIQAVVGERVVLVSSAEETAKDVYATLFSAGLQRDPELPAPAHRFLATGDPAPFATLGHRFLGPVVGTVEPAAEVLT